VAGGAEELDDGLATDETSVVGDLVGAILAVLAVAQRLIGNDD